MDDIFVQIFVCEMSHVFKELALQREILQAGILPALVWLEHAGIN